MRTKKRPSGANGDITPKGRPKKEIDQDRALELYSYGFTDQEVANILGVHRETLQKRREADADFSDAIKGAKDKADGEVIRALYRRAIGGTWNGREVPPESLACIYWLNNRQREKWRQKNDVQVSVNESDLRRAMATVAKSLVESPGQGVGTPDNQEVSVESSEIQDDTRGTQELQE